MLGWSLWKKSFDAWEDATARLLEQWLKNPLVLGPTATMISQLLQAKAASDDAKASIWGELGLPTKRDQERTLHLLNQLQSRILDLEEKLDDARAVGGRIPSTPSTPSTPSAPLSQSTRTPSKE